MERKQADPTFIDAFSADLGGPKTQAFFDLCDQFIPWSKLAASVGDLFADRDPSKGGRPHWPVVLILRCLMLAKWFNLSDPQLEELLKDRISFRRFVGLSLSDTTPDETTFVKWRKRLGEAGHASTLFDTTVEHLRDKGLILNKGTLVDATLIEAPKGRVTAEGLGHTQDRGASYTQKHGRTYHGYKAHAATDANGFVTDYVFDTAKVHDSKHADQLMEGEPAGGAVYADSAYRSKARQASLAERGVDGRIMHKRVRGQKALSESQQRENRLWASVRAKVEHVFGWMKNMGYGRARYRGLSRNGFDFALMAIAYNFKRSFHLLNAAA